MRYLLVLATMLPLAISSTTLAANHPELSELTPLLARPIDSNEVQAIVKKYHLSKVYKFDSGEFAAQDEAYTLMFRENRICAIILRASPIPNGHGGGDWATYSHPLPGNLKATDSRNEVEKKLGKPTEPGGSHWIDEKMDLRVIFGEKDISIEEVWVSSPPAKP